MSTTTAAPAVTYTIRELAKATGLCVSTIHNYTHAGLLPPPRRRGPATAYTEEHMLRVRALRMLRMRGASIAWIRSRLPSMTLDEVRAMVDPPKPAPPTSSEPETAPGAEMERWERATLVPGLELMVRADAGPLVRRLAREIVANYRAE